MVPRLRYFSRPIGRGPEDDGGGVGEELTPSRYDRRGNFHVRNVDFSWARCTPAARDVACPALERCLAQNGSPGANTCAVVDFVVRPIGFVRSPFREKAEAPRQAVAEGGDGVEGSIEMLPEHEHALDDLDGFDRIWVLFWFHEAKGGPRTKVLPPRSDRKRGVIATRSPHRPNPIGMSAVRLVRVEGLVLHVRDLDLIDGTPVIDVKPYIPYADAFPDAATGWLGGGATGASGARGARDPRPAWSVTFTEGAEAQLAWLATQGLAVDLRARIKEALALGPQPHPYRRIKKTDEGELLLAVKEWRARFTVDAAASSIAVDTLRSGFRPRELANGDDPALTVHRAFVALFG
ncbi:MAG: tRNA (adenine37-N6)-methyltransferase [Myxococcales bacterium]|nr:tRNA (adenine37-N6)-methyltransferase [Myxococcales bacterium]